MGAGPTTWGCALYASTQDTNGCHAGHARFYFWSQGPPGPRTSISLGGCESRRMFGTEVRTAKFYFARTLCIFRRVTIRSTDSSSEKNNLTVFPHTATLFF